MVGSPRRCTSRHAVVVAALVLAIGFVGAGGPARAAPGRVEGWDPRLAPIAKRVEELRHLQFKRPVPATFLTVAKFRKRVTEDDSKVTRKERRELRIGEAELRTLGLVDGSFDLLKTVNDVSGSSVLAYYDPDDERIVVRGKKLDAEARVTLAHELTHGLQDQHYDLNRLRSRAKTSGADDAIVALVEGDATRIETKYYFGLSNRQQREVDRAETDGGAEAGRPGAESPALESPEAAGAAAANGFVGALFESPYAFGPQMVDVILSAKHRPGLAAAFRHPPTTQLQFLVPTRALSGAALTPLRRPSVPAGAHRVGGDQPDDFGAADLYFLLSSRLPAAVSLRAAGAWGNGKELISETKRETCVDVAFKARGRGGAERLGSAVRLWAAAMPPGAIRVSKNGLAIHGCDPGKTAVGPVNAAESALGFAAIRSYFVSELVAAGAPGPVAACLGDRIVERPAFDTVVSRSEENREPTKSEVDAISTAIEELIPGCA